MASLAERVSNLRTSNAHALLEAIKHPGLSEFEIHRRWVDELSRIPSLHTVGWYSPPPDGASILIGHPPNFERTNYQSIRMQDKWPSKENSLNEESLVYAFSSPVTKNDFLIGDFGLPLYRGSSLKVKQQLREVLSLTVASAQLVEEGIKFRDLYANCNSLYASHGFENHISSVTDPLSSNIGHTLPWTYCAVTSEELDILNSEDTAKSNALISSRRVFINSESTLKVGGTMALTIEPKLTSGSIIPVGFHITVVIEDGKRYLVTGFQHLLKFLKMDTYLDARDLNELDAYE